MKPESNEVSSTVGDQLIERIAQDIMSGALASGMKIVETELAARYAVSRPTLREAIGRLEERRLVIRTPHAGARVARLSRQEIIEMFVVREALEGMACRLAALNAPEVEFERLRQHLQFEDTGLRAYHDAPVHERSAHAASQAYPPYGDLDLHIVIARLSGVRLLEEHLQSDLNRLTRLYRFKDLDSRGDRGHREHRRIVEAIIERDADMAELAGRRHIAGIRDEFIRLTEGNEDWLSLCA